MKRVSDPLEGRIGHIEKALDTSGRQYHFSIWIGGFLWVGSPDISDGYTCGISTRNPVSPIGESVPNFSDIMAVPEAAEENSHWMGRNGAHGRVDRPEIPVRLHYSEGDKEWRNWRYLGVFYNPLEGTPDNGAARGMTFFKADKQSFLIYEAGQKSSARIALLELKTGPAPDGH